MRKSPSDDASAVVAARCLRTSRRRSIASVVTVTSCSENAISRGGEGKRLDPTVTAEGRLSFISLEANTLHRCASASNSLSKDWLVLLTLTIHCWRSRSMKPGSYIRPGVSP